MFTLHSLTPVRNINAEGSKAEKLYYPYYFSTVLFRGLSYDE